MRTYENAQALMPLRFPIQIQVGFMAVNYKVIGANIKKRRKELHITQAKMAEELYLSISLISKLERGVKAISLDTFDLIATYLGSSIPELMEDPQQPLVMRSHSIKAIAELLEDMDQPHIEIFYQLLLTYKKNVSDVYRYPKQVRSNKNKLSDSLDTAE